MTRRDYEQDERLVAFLKEYAPAVTPPPASLEEHIMAAVTVPGLAYPSSAPRRGRRSATPGRLLMPLLAFSLSMAALATLFVYKQEEKNKREETEAFLDSNWQGLMLGGDTATDTDQVEAYLADAE